MLVLLSIVCHFGFFTTPPVVFYKNDSGLASYLFNFLPQFPGVALSFFYHLIVLVQALRLNSLLQNNKLLQDGYLPAMTYILFTALLPYWSNITPALLSNFFIIWLLHLFFKLAHQEDKAQTCFNIGFVAGIAILFYVPLITLALVMMIAIFIPASFNIKNLVLYLLGIVVPLYFLLSILYLTNHLDILTLHFPRFGWEVPHFLSARDIIIALASVCVAVLLGAFSLNNHYLVIIARNGWTFLFILFFITGLSIFFLKNYSFETLIIILLPASAIASNFFINTRSKIFSSLVFWMLLLAGYYGFIEQFFFNNK